MDNYGSCRGYYEMVYSIIRAWVYHGAWERRTLGNCDEMIRELIDATPYHRYQLAAVEAAVHSYLIRNAHWMTRDRCNYPAWLRWKAGVDVRREMVCNLKYFQIKPLPIPF